MRTRAMLLALAVSLVLAAPAGASFPGRNGLIAVAANSDSTSDTIWVGDRDGIGLHALPSPCRFDVLDNCFVDAPSWSPDGTRLVFSSDRNSMPSLWTVNADGTDLQQVPGAHGYFPAWSPDGNRIVFSVTANSTDGCHYRDLYTVEADGSGLALLVKHGDKPDWSAGGDIVYEHQHARWSGGPNSECWPTSTIDVLRPGKAPRRVARGIDPSWAPGGRVIAYSGPGGVRRKRIGAKGPGRLLVRARALIYEPTWSPNGHLVLYRRAAKLGLIRALGGHRMRLGFDAPGIDFSSSWQPLPR